MTLREYINDNSGIIYVGVKDGTGYMFIGESDKLAENEQTDKEKYLELYAERAKHWKLAKESALRNLQDAQDRKCKYAFQRENRLKALEFYKNRADLDAEHEQSFYKRIELLNARPSMLDAEVVETYKRRFVKPLGQCILIDYMPNSMGYWDIGEYENREITLSYKLR